MMMMIINDDDNGDDDDIYDDNNDDDKLTMRIRQNCLIRTSQANRITMNQMESAYGIILHNHIFQ